MKKTTYRILVVDDEEQMRRSYVDALAPATSQPQALADLETELFGTNAKPAEDVPFEVVCASQGLEGVETVRAAASANTPFRVAFIDVRMPPGIDGVETACRIREIDPQINIVIVTGYSDVDVSDMARRILPADKLFFISKPLHVAEIRQQASALSARWMADAGMIRTLQEQNESLKQALTETELARTEALKAGLAKSNFISNVSHELRTPLNAIIGFSDILKSEIYGPLGDPRYVDYSTEIGSAGQGLLKSINDIIDTSRLDAGRLTIDLEDVNIADITMNAISTLRALEAGKSIVWDIRDETGGATAIGDPRRIGQTVSAILHNAMKFSPAGSTVSVIITELAGFIRVCISDQGNGIPPDILKMTESPFTHNADVFTRHQGGLGLGLWLAKKLLELQGGRFEVASTGKSGTTIHMDFARADRREQAA